MSGERALLERIRNLQPGLTAMWPLILAVVIGFVYVRSWSTGRLGNMSDRDVGAARIALMALHADVTGFSPKPLRVRVNAGNPTTVEEAARTLAAQPKPVRCTSSKAGSVLLVRCERITDARFLSIQHDDRTRWAQSWAEKVEALGLSATQSSFLVRSAADSVVVPLHTIQALLKDYRVYCALALLHDADSEARSRGANAVIELRNARGVRMIP